MSLPDFVAVANGFVLKLFFKLKFTFENQHKKEASQTADTWNAYKPNDQLISFL